MAGVKVAVLHRGHNFDLASVSKHCLVAVALHTFSM